MVVGSRYLLKSSLDGWNPWRKALTRIGHLLTLALLRMPYDATNAFRCYRLDRIPRQLFDVVVSRGYSFFFESLYVLHRNRFRITEVPIPLPKRTYGSSKMSLREVRNSVRLLFAICFKALFNPEKFEVGEEVEAAGTADALRDDQGWDDYWDGQKTGAGGLALRRRGRLLPEVDHPPGPEPIRAPLLQRRARGCCTPAAAADRWTPTSATRSPSRGSTSP